MTSLMRRMLWVPLVTIAVLAVAMIACSNDSSTPAATTPTQAPPATAAPTTEATAAPEPTEDPDGPLNFNGAASGTITVYTAGPAGLSDELKAAFEAATGATVELFQGNTGSVMARLDAERARPQADVVILADWSAAVEMALAGELAEYLPRGHERVPDLYKDPMGRFIAQGVSVLALVYNTTLGDAPQEWEDLLGPEWAGEVTMPNPAESGSAYDWVSAIVQNWGADRAWALFEGLRDNEMEVPGTNAAALNPVVAGAKRAVIAGVDYITLGQIAAGEPLGIVYPASGTAAAARPMMIMKDAPNMDGAKAFIDFILSDEGQAMIANRYILPARADVAPHPDRLGYDDIVVLPVDYELSIELRDEVLGRFSSDIAR